MSSSIAKKFRAIVLAGLIIAPLLLISTFFSDSFLNSEQTPTAFGATETSSQTAQRLVPMGKDYQTLDPGEASAGDDPSATIGNFDYPGPSLRGYPEPLPFKRLQLNFKFKKGFTALLNAISAYFDIDAGTTDSDAEIQIFRLMSLSNQVDNRVVGEAISIQLFDEDGNPITDFNKPVIITFSLGANGMSIPNNYDTSIKAYQWSQAARGWVGVESTYSAEDNTITAVIERPGEIALLRNMQIYMPSIQQ